MTAASGDRDRSTDLPGVGVGGSLTIQASSVRACHCVGVSLQAASFLVPSSLLLLLLLLGEGLTFFEDALAGLPPAVLAPRPRLLALGVSTVTADCCSGMAICMYVGSEESKSRR